MTSVGIHCEAVWKRFKRGSRTDNLRDLLPAIGRRLLGKPVAQRESFWALRDLSFEVRAGEALGIIGPNGAGKSTVLKLLNGILRPTRGRVQITGSSGQRGRVGALIELAAGFHSELTGRENVFLQGAIMGMTRAMIRNRFDEIVEFAEISAFIDTPVKRYSSGMHARLGFAVAAHLDPDVLLIDEILAVGDRGYQQKAFDRLREMVLRGIPTVVVSHQLGRVAGLCDRGLLLEQGEVRAQGPIAEVVAAYLNADSPEAAPSDSPIRLQRVRLEPTSVVPGEWVTVHVAGETHPDADLSAVLVGIRVRELPSYEPIYHARTRPAEMRGRFNLEVKLQMNLGPGSYHVQPIVWREQVGRRAAGLARGPYALVDVGGDRYDPHRVFMHPHFEFTHVGGVT